MDPTQIIPTDSTINITPVTPIPVSVVGSPARHINWVQIEEVLISVGKVAIAAAITSLIGYLIKQPELVGGATLTLVIKSILEFALKYFPSN